MIDPVPPIVAAGSACAIIGLMWKGGRGFWIATAVGPICGLIFWIGVSAYELTTQGWADNKFAVANALAMGVPITAIAWLAGALPGGLAGYGLRRLISLIGSSRPR